MITLHMAAIVIVSMATDLCMVGGLGQGDQDTSRCGSSGSGGGRESDEGHVETGSDEGTELDEGRDAPERLHHLISCEVVLGGT